MKTNRKNLLVIFFTSIFLIGCSTEDQGSRTQSLFDTKAEAEYAAKDFNCKGAHKMGSKWMPCKSHEMHDEHNDHGHHHNH